ncbi:MAG TPA: DUF1648 domain-containing protein [Acidobacteriaceae bacterium]
MKVLREGIATAGLLFITLTMAKFYRALPPIIATHFGASGAADGWGDKSSLWVLVGVTFALYAALTAVPYLPERFINLPVRAEQRAAAMPIAMEMIGWIKVETVSIFVWLVWSTVSVARGFSTGLSPLFLPVVIVVELVMVVLTFWRTMQAGGSAST